VGVKGGYLALQLAAAILLARWLGPEDFGTFSFALAMVALLTIPAQLGFPGLLLRMVPIHLARSELGTLRGLAARSVQLVTLASVVIAAAWLLTLGPIGVRLGDMPSGPLTLAAGLIPLVALIVLAQNALVGLGRPVLGQVPGQLVRPGAFLLALFLIQAAGRITVESAILANVGASGLALAGAGWLWLRTRPPGAASPPVEGSTAGWLRDATPFLLLAGAQVIAVRTDLLMLGLLMDPEDVGKYRVAVQIADGLGMILVAFSAVIAPHLARLHATGDLRAVQRILVGSHRLGLLVLLPVSLALALGAVPLLGLIFGPEYSSAAHTMRILVLGRAAYAAIGFSGLALSMFGLASLASAATMVMAGANVGLNLLLIPPFGMTGAASATVTSTLLVNVAVVLIIKIKLGANVTAFGRTSA
jgi:O-antigen/teichoic acid export membrane protein